MANETGRNLASERDDAPGSAEHDDGRKTWEQTCAELTEERDRLRAEVVRLRAERDQYLKSLYALTRKDFSFRREEILPGGKAGPTLDQVLAELEQARGT